jgi:tetratricopeptide (TPR) repeat protein
MKKRLLQVSWVTLALCAAGVLTFGYYYWKTPASTVLIIPSPFPPGLSPGFTPDQLGSSLLSSIEGIRVIAQPAVPSAQSIGLQVGPLPIASAKEPAYTILRNPLPIFDQKFRGIGIGMVREWAVQAKVKQFILIDATAAASSGNGFLLHAMLQDRSSFRIERDWWVPLAGDSCLVPIKTCTRELAEDILAYQQPDRCRAYDAIGYFYLLKYQTEGGSRNLDAAEDAYRRATSCDNNDATAYCNWGNALIRKWVVGGRVDSKLADQALEYAQRALDLNPKLAEAAVNLAYLQYMRGQHQGALDYFRKINRDFPTSPAVSLNFGFVLYREYLGGKPDLQDAIDKTQRAWELAPNYIAANNLGFFYFETGDWTNAVRYWKEAYRLNSDDTDVLGGLALGLYKSGQRDEAIASYRKAIDREPAMKDPQYLQSSHLWSKKAAEDVVPLIQAAGASP